MNTAVNAARADTPQAIRVGVPTRTERFMPAIVAAVAMLVYANALRNGFVLDDEGVLVHNDVVHAISGVWRAFLAPYWPSGAGQYRPLVIASFSAEWNVFGGAALGFHAINVLWHAAASVLAYAFLRRWLSFGGSAIAALCFAVHPVHVEAVANVVGRSELMAATFVLATLILHDRRSPWAILTFAAALLSKEHALVTPLLAVALDLLSRDHRAPHANDAPPRRVAPVYAGYAVVSLVWAVTLFVLFRGRAFVDVAPFWSSMNSDTRLLTVLGIVPVWARLWFFPADLSSDYSPRATLAWPDNAPLAIMGAVLIVSAIAMMVAARRTRPAVAGFGWLALTIAPVANVIVPTGVIVAERTLYLSSVGAMLLLGLVVELVARRRHELALVGAVVIIGAGVMRTWTRTPVWESNRTLFIDAAASHPEASWTHGSLGRVYAGNGGFARAAEEYRLSLTLFDKNPVIWSEGILSAMNAGNISLADSLIGEAERRLPPRYEISIAHAYVALAQHRYSESLRASRLAVSIAPDSAPGWLFAGIAWDALGVPDSARTALARVSPRHPLRKTADSILAALPPPPV